jgi:hypothetical protein
VVVPVES